MVWILLLLMVTADAEPRDSRSEIWDPNPENLEHQALLFPYQTNTDYVKIFPSVQTFKELTVCVRVKTDLCRNHVIISWATSYNSNAFLLYWDHDNDRFLISVCDVEVGYTGLDYDLNKWHSICVTWDSTTGQVQLWFDGHYTPLKYVGGGQITEPCIMMGQEQDSYCGHFDEHQCFVGEIANLEIWSKVLDVCEIQHYMDYQNFCPGNAASWRELRFSKTGKITTGDVQICSQDYPKNGYPFIPTSEDYPATSSNDDYYYHDSSVYTFHPVYRPYSDDYKYNRYEHRIKTKYNHYAW